MPEIAEAATVRLRLFGQIALSVQRGAQAPQPIAVAGLPARLLAFLALHPARRYSRAELVASLWADGHGKSPAASLSTALWRLRQNIDSRMPGLPPLVECTADGLLGIHCGVHSGIHGGSTVWVDHAEFGQLVAPALDKPQHALTPADLAALRQGVELHATALLPCLTDDWVLRERELARQQWLKALQRLLHASRSSGDHEHAAACAQTMLDADPLREDIHRQLMCIHAESGQRPLALRQFEACRDVLARELGVPPLPETVQLYRDIARHDGSTPQPVAPPGVERRRAAAPASAAPGDREATVSLLIEARTALARVETALAAALRFQGAGLRP